MGHIEGRAGKGCVVSSAMTGLISGFLHRERGDHGDILPFPLMKKGGIQPEKSRRGRGGIVGSTGRFMPP